jgi:hypothetical protein
MSLVSQTVSPLIDGVSQQADSLRLPSQGDEQINMYDSLVHGKMTRPPAEYGAKINASSAYEGVQVHEIIRDSADRYRVIFLNGSIQVYNAVTGSPETVETPDGTAYLLTADPLRDIRAVTVGDYTFFTNRTIEVKRGTKKSGAAKNEALIWVRAADYGTKYTLTLDGVSTSFFTSLGTSASSRQEISTEEIAKKFVTAIEGNSAFDGYTVTQYGSSVYIVKTDGTDFTIAVSDGLADTGVLAVKGSVQKFEDLPARAKNGFVVEVAGDASNKFDNYYVVYDDNGTPSQNGVWRETVRPDVLVALDAATMPHQLVKDGVVKDDLEHKGVPAGPTYAKGGEVLVLDGWEDAADSGINRDRNKAVVMRAHGTSLQSNLEGLTAEEAEIRAYFDINTSPMQTGESIRVALYISTGTADVFSTTPGRDGDSNPALWTLLQEKTYEAGLTLVDEYVSGTVTSPANHDLRLCIFYASAAWGTEGPTESKRAIVTTHPQTHIRQPGIQIRIPKSRAITFDPTLVYPQGMQVDALIDAVLFTRTLATDETGAQLATALNTLIDAHANFISTQPSTGKLEVKRAAGGIPTASVTFTFSTTTKFFNSDLSLTPSSLVGKTLENLSDGSKGVVSANTATTITVAPLAGGVNNVFAKGDLCRVVGAAGTWVFSRVEWREREVGDLSTNPYPSFVGKKINEVFFTRNRLGFTAQENVVLSGAGDMFNFFRSSSVELLDDDVIDVQSASQDIAYFHSAVEWNEAMYLFSDNGMYLLSGDPILTPSSVRLDRVGKFINSPKVRPLVSGNRLFFTRGKPTATQVMEVKPLDADTFIAEDITKHVPTYLKGQPVDIAGDDTFGFLAVLTDNDRKHLFVHSYRYDGEDKIQSSWSRWEFAAGTYIVSISMVDGTLVLITKHSDGLFLETINLDVTI